MASTDKRCSKCKVVKGSVYFGEKKNGQEYKTCLTCRGKKLICSDDTMKDKCIVDYDKELKPFLDYDEIKKTCEGYGYNILNLPICNKEDLEASAEYIKFKLMNTKTMLLVNYNEINLWTFYFLETLPKQIKNDANKNFPCVIMKFKNENTIFTYVMRTCNSLKYFYDINRLKNPRRCEICLTKTKHFRSCYRCHKNICSNCLKSLPSLICPYCKYDILEHSCKMNELYHMC